ncbi:MAG: cytochrome c1 [Colwelliaceae bacterium]|jgi:ubiquinol-cytochrome c reductase cytochrome c1 subunit|nr:cytochrome c1 [Colwelliaceae bacterium]
MKKLFITLLAMVPALAFAAGPSLPLDSANNDLADKESLKRGFKAYINYCLGCHELQYQRYNRTFADLGISDEEGKAEWMYTGEKVGDHITNSMPAKEAAQWFGSAPPDLTLEARFRSPDYIYTYLRSFYTDENRPFGVNNTIFPDVGMPHVLQNLQGVRTKDENGVLSPAVGGTMTEQEYDAFVRDLTNFLEYVGEPNKLERKELGKWVIGFLFIFFILSYFLKKEYWRDIH